MNTNHLRRFADEIETNKAYDHKKLADEIRNRIHRRLLGSDESTSIGVPPTPMWETGDSFKAVKIQPLGWTTMSYHRLIERFMGTEIYELTESELDTIAELIVDYFDNL